MTKKDCEKQGGKIDPNTEVAEWVQYRATCSAEKKVKNLQVKHMVQKNKSRSYM